jgi:RimJ/RimL family protein N-acetyltransferase
MPTEVSLTLIRRRDAEDVQRLASHPDVVATTNLPNPYPDDGAKQWIENLLPRQEAGREYAFGIRNVHEEFVGIVGLVDVDEQEAELGFWIGKPFWNRGYATAAAQKIVDFAFEELGLGQLFARPLRRNSPSRRVLEKLAFVEQGVETHEHPKWEEEDNVLRYELSRSEWSKEAGPEGSA